MHGRLTCKLHTLRPSAASELFILWLPGGGWCSDEGGGCGPYGRPWGSDAYEGLPPGGFLPSVFRGGEDVRGVLGTANVAVVNYCTGDSHAGDGRGHRGARVVSAVLRDLVDRRGMAPGSTLVVGGCSAGARGTLYNTERVVAFAESVNVTLGGLVASSPLAVTDEAEARRAYEGLPLNTSLGEACASAHASEPWRCLLPATRLPYATALARTLLITSVRDTMVSAFKKDPLAYRALVIAAANSSSDAWISSCASHCMEERLGESATVGGVSIGRALEVFLAGHAVRAVDDGEACWDTVGGEGCAERCRHCDDTADGALAVCGFPGAEEEETASHAVPWTTSDAAAPLQQLHAVASASVATALLGVGLYGAF